MDGRRDHDLPSTSYITPIPLCHIFICILFVQYRKDFVCTSQQQKALNAVTDRWREDTRQGKIKVSELEDRGKVYLQWGRIERGMEVNTAVKELNYKFGLWY